MKTEITKNKIKKDKNNKLKKIFLLFMSFQKFCNIGKCLKMIQIHIKIVEYLVNIRNMIFQEQIQHKLNKQ